MLCWLLVLSLFCSSAWSNTYPVVRDPRVDSTTYQAHLASRKSAVPLSRYLVNQPLTSEVVEEFNRLLRQAQSHYFGKSLAEARNSFRQLVNLSHQADWPQAQRKALFFSHIRLAQLSDSPEDRSQWLRKAAQFAYDLPLDKDLFPPPIQQEYSQVHSTLEMVSLVPNESWRNFTYLVVNGLVYPLGHAAKILVPNATHRFTWLSDQNLPYNDVTQASKMAYTQIPSLPAVSGPCTDPKIHPTLPPLTQVYAGQNCKKINTEWALHPEPPRAPAQVNLPSNVHSEPEQAKPTWTKSRWLWLGASAVTLAAVYLANQDRSESERRIAPSHRKGF